MLSATTTPAAAGISEAELRLIIHHVFLTPGHPQSGDDTEGTNAAENAFLSFVCDALRSAREAIALLRDSKNAFGALDPQKLLNVFDKVSQLGAVLPIHVEAQNATIIVRRENDWVIFEFSELAPQNEAVMGIKGRLKRHFPGSAVSIPLHVFDDPEFQSSLAKTISRMGMKEVKGVKAKVKKAEDIQIKELDTTDPAVVTDFLATVLSALGKVAQVPVLAKNTREQVSWKNAKLPWRRSTVWLLARVTMQSIMSRAAEPLVYKQFMVFLLSVLLEVSVSFQLCAETLHHMMAKISGRLQKLGPDAQKCLVGGVAAVMANAATCIEASWTAAQAVETKLVMRDITELSRQEKYFDCPGLDTSLLSISSRLSSTNRLECKPAWYVPTYAESVPPSTAFSGRGHESLVQLLAFEDLVVSSLNSWLNNNIDSERTPGNLLELIKRYHGAAQVQYAGSPEATSLMILTVLELWIACDKSACRNIALLKDFGHEIPPRLLQSLIRPFKRDMERLHTVETYLQSRQEESSTKQNPSIFSDFGT